MKGLIRKHFTPWRAVLILTTVLFLNYVDRGIVAGVSLDIKGCVASRELCPTLPPTPPCPGHERNYSNPCELCRVCGEKCKGEIVQQTGFGIGGTGLGVLQSAFMLGYIAGAVWIAQLSSHIRPFKLISIGLSCWVLASLGSAASGWLCSEEHDGAQVCNSYYLMVAMRAVSGVGEAGMNTLSLPFLDDILPSNVKGRYIGLYYAAIPVGTACGFIWGGVIASVTGGAWEWAFALQAPLMIPFSFLLYFVPEDLGNESSETELGQDQESDRVPSDREGNRGETNSRVSGGSSALNSASSITLFENLRACVEQPAFILGCLAYACYTGVVAGLGYYGPQFIQNYRPCDKRWNFSQTMADVIFGLVIVTSGLVGTVSGGWVVDRVKAHASRDKLQKAIVCTLTMELIVGLGVSFGATRLDAPVSFFLVLLLGSVAMFMVTPGFNMVLISMVPYNNRPMAAALSVLIIHLFGDVPSPILIGYLSDTTSPLFTLSATICSLSAAVLLLCLVLSLPAKIGPDACNEADSEVEDDSSLEPLLSSS